MSETSPSPTPCFVDTNVWLYAFIAGTDTAKSERAQQLLRAKESSLVVSSQVINEICVNLVRKAHLPETDIRKLIRSFYHKYPVVLLDQALQTSASQLRERFSLSFWDSLIVAAAEHCEATVLYSEDMQAGLRISERLTIQNPFDDLSG